MTSLARPHAGGRGTPASAFPAPADAERLLAGVLEAVEALSPEAAANLLPVPGLREDTPRSLLRLLTYCYATGVFASSEIEAQLHSDPVLRYLAGGERPESGSLRGFRRRHRSVVQRCLARTLQSTSGPAPGVSRELCPSRAYAQDSLDRWQAQARGRDFEAEAADRIRRAVCDDTALLDE